MRWRVDGVVPEKPAYVKRLRELGIDQSLIDAAAANELATRRSLSQRVESLEEEVEHLKQTLRTARLAAERIRVRLVKLEERVAPLLEDRTETGSTRRARSGR
jgi:chromosome segregation ATPase